LLSKVKFLNFKNTENGKARKSNPLRVNQKQALEQFRADKSLTGKGGAFAPLFKQFLEAALQYELEQHLVANK
jgi:hypothetical protein